MSITSNEIIGSLVYRTSTALTKDANFMETVKDYYFYNSIVSDNVFHLWHFPGTQQEISEVFKTLGTDSINGSKLKFPSILNFQSVYQTHQNRFTERKYNLAIVAPVLSDWTTQQREAQVYKLLLQRIEEEFIRQVIKCEYLQNDVGDYPYISLYVPTTGSSFTSVIKMQYGDFMDAVELPNFTIKTINNICIKNQKVIDNESKKVTDEIKNLII